MSRASTAILLLFVMAILIATTHGWMSWGGDDAMYIMNARDIALGQPYGVTAYLHNPLNPIHPAAPPPGFPLFLAPVYAVWGLHWIAFKYACLALFALFLAVFAVVAGERLPPLWALGVLALIGCHPYTWRLKETMPPEFPFMFYAYAGLWLAERSITGQAISTSRHRMLLVLGAGLCIGAAYVTRPIGIVLLPAIVMGALFRSHKQLRVGVIAIGIAVVIALAVTWTVEHFLRPDLGTYIGYVQSLGWQSLKHNLKAYNIAARYLLEDHLYARTLAGAALLWVVIATIGVGFVVRARERLSVFEWFTLGYAGLLLIYPISLEPDRYSYPLWPLLFLYAFVGCQWIGEHLPRAVRYAPIAALASVLLVNFATTYHRFVHYYRADRAAAAEVTAFYDFLKRNLPRNAVVISRQPTVVALLTNRQSAIWPARADDEQFRGYMKEIHAQYVIEDRDFSRPNPENTDELHEFVAHNKSSLELVHARGVLNLYRLSE